MPKVRSNIEKAAGKLISSIQKEWGHELGESQAETTEQVMDLAHDLLQASTKAEIQKVLDGKSLEEYLGTDWVQEHPAVAESILVLEKALS